MVEVGGKPGREAAMEVVYGDEHYELAELAVMFELVR